MRKYTACQKEKRKMLMFATEHVESAPLLVFGEKSRGGPAVGGCRRLQGAATFPGSWPTTSLSGQLNLPCAGENRVDGSIGGDLLQRDAVLIAKGDGEKKGSGEEASRRTKTVTFGWNDLDFQSNQRGVGHLKKELSEQFLSGTPNLRTFPPGVLPAN